MGLATEMLREFLRGMEDVEAIENAKSMSVADNLPTIC
jgi:hypothetical protein